MILYIIFTFLIGLPVFIAELVLGRKSQKSSVFAYSDLGKKYGNWKILGWLNLLTCFIILAYYSVVAGWCLSYIIMSLTQFSANKTPDQIRSVFETLFQSADINILWLFIFMLINIGVVYSGVRKGIEYWSKRLMPALFVILIGLFLYSTTLSGFPKAVKYLFTQTFLN